MSRRTKDPEERRLEIVQTAKQIFMKKGFDNTQISDITKEMGVAHGLVYHYFKSKSELFDAVVDEWANEALAKFIPILNDKSLTVLNRLELAFRFRESYPKTESASTLTEIVHRQDFAKTLHRIRATLLLKVLPVLVDLIQQGNDDGSLNCPYPEEAAKFCLYGSGAADDGRLTEADINKRIKYFCWRILGANSE